MRLAKILEMRFRALMTTALFAFVFGLVSAQERGTMRYLEFRYGFQIPIADMKDRFGSNSQFGLGIQSVSKKDKIILGLEGMYFFGNTVQEDVVTQLRSYDGSIIGIDGAPGDVNLKERGYYIGFNAGKIFSTGAHPQKLTGIRAIAGGGLLQHKIRVQDNFNTIVPLEKKYQYGYDRLTNGPAIHLGVGYQYQSPIHNLHFHVMGDLYAARTASRRDIDFATGEYLGKKRTDILAGLSIAYIVTISRTEKPDHIYY